MHTSFLKTFTSGRFGRTAVALGLLFGVTGCTDQQKTGDSASYLTIVSLVASPGGSTGDSKSSVGTTTLSSDVRTFGAAFDDPMVATMRVGMKNPNFATSPTNFITVQKYHVKYIRTDGGPVPEPFDASATFTVTDADTSSGTIVLVKAGAKNLSPLSNLVGTAQSIPVTAEVTFDGVDQAGKATSVTGFIQITFADWIDPGVDPVTPVAAFTVAPAAGLRAGQQLIVDATTSVVPNGRTVKDYTWDFGDGTVVSSGISPVFQHVYGSSGQYKIRLTVTDSAGQTYIAEKVIPVI